MVGFPKHSCVIFAGACLVHDKEGEPVATLSKLTGAEVNRGGFVSLIDTDNELQPETISTSESVTQSCA